MHRQITLQATRISDLKAGEQASLIAYLTVTIIIVQSSNLTSSVLAYNTASSVLVFFADHLIMKFLLFGIYW